MIDGDSWDVRLAVGSSPPDAGSCWAGRWRWAAEDVGTRRVGIRPSSGSSSGSIPAVPFAPGSAGCSFANTGLAGNLPFRQTAHFAVRRPPVRIRRRDVVPDRALAVPDARTSPVDSAGASDIPGAAVHIPDIPLDLEAPDLDLASPSSHLGYPNPAASHQAKTSKPNKHYHQVHTLPHVRNEHI